jgi:hypothetical protein
MVRNCRNGGNDGVLSCEDFYVRKHFTNEDIFFELFRMPNGGLHNAGCCAAA